MGLELVGKVATAFFFEQVIVLKRITASNDYLIFFFITLIHFTFYYFYLIFLKFFLGVIQTDDWTNLEIDEEVFQNPPSEDHHVTYRLSIVKK